MSEKEIKSFKNPFKPLDPVYITNQYASFSTITNDVIFNNENVNDPIFCGGLVEEFGQDIYNFKKNDFVAYISYTQDLKTTISSKLLFKVNSLNINLIFILPYASYAMKILRNIKPKIGQNIIIIGLNFFSILLCKIFRISGANVYIIKTKEQYKNYKLNNEITRIQLENDNINNKFLDEEEIHEILVISRFNPQIEKLLKSIHKNLINKEIRLIGPYKYIDIERHRELNLTHINMFDIGMEDPYYKFGIKYPYSYLRWDYRRNLKYFIYLTENNYLNLDFLNVEQKNMNSLKELLEFVKINREQNLFLFKILNA